ncbi:MAG: HAD-IG family 5'-nucleotidase [Candidatus Eisenbacteria bacterium]|uniref:HAD-IG family 5'-nucleotidase n=1 Tax=Eiseniibacteriota bacterium TaxID=2212470 RepID=A0A948W8X7_UNCEI|nr:HAD-IG family 5'-nucleotidase [Candidatus Eisenbacteria bacterium]MBU1950729.1 HAD-IG family 5'-nucleotidase [Candidatus Eisenbacteria bacterium]MBU2693161.1 HAD-IG family 5'-nucleotidase [Candidatus Eisenbacteria bacterium]
MQRKRKRSHRKNPVGRWLQHQVDVEPIDRIYVNRSLRMDSIAAVGFDMDHTLAIYKSKPFETLAFEKAQQKLMVKWGYPKSVEDLKYDKDFVIRGLVVDKRLGNILKMDKHRYVSIASHGTRPLSDEVRKQIYSNRRIRLSSGNYSVIDTLFSLPEISLYAQMVDLIDKIAEGEKGQRGRKEYRRLYEHVRDCVDEAHADDSIKKVIIKNPLQYTDIDPDLPQTLQQIRAHRKRLFLLTNSEPIYTDVIMSKLLSNKLRRLPHWTDYFDAVVLQAGKPDFFTHRLAFQPVNDIKNRVPIKNRRRIFIGGSVQELQKFLKVRGDQVLYFGDHTYGDILSSKHSSGWRTAMIIQDLEEGLAKVEQTTSMRKKLLSLERRKDRLVGWRDFLERSKEGQLGRKLAEAILSRLNISTQEKRGGLEYHLGVLQKEILSLEEQIEGLESDLHMAFNPHWGPIFKAGRENSHFGAQVHSFACIYTSRVSNFLNYPVNKYFEAPHEYLPHEQ